MKLVSKGILASHKGFQQHLFRVLVIPDIIRNLLFVCSYNFTKNEKQKIIYLFYINKWNIRSKANLKNLKEIYHTLHKIHCAKYKS